MTQPIGSGAPVIEGYSVPESPNIPIPPVVITPFNLAPPPTTDDLADVVGNNAYFNNLWVKGSPVGGGLSLPISQNLTFSPDSTYDIGNSDYTLRPRQVYVSNGITFRDPSNTSILRFDPTAGHQLALTPITAQANNEQSLNIYSYYSTNSLWGRLMVGPLGIIQQHSGAITPLDLLIGSEDVESIWFETNFSNRWKIDGTTGALLAGSSSIDIGKTGVTNLSPRHTFTGTLNLTGSPRAAAAGEISLGFQFANVGAGGVATLGNTGGTGPVTPAMNQWMAFNSNNQVYWIPIWR